MLQFKRQKETEREHAHTNVFHGDDYLGYYMKDELQKELVFTSKNDKIQYFRAKNKSEIESTLTKQLNKEKVTLKQHFGIITELN